MEDSFSESEYTEYRKNSKNEPLRQFVEAYESLPELWQCSHGAYKNRTKRNLALDKLVPLYELVKPGATREDVKKKINSLRTNFRKELKKIISSKRSGAGGSEVYQPQTWTFQALQFLRGCEQPVPVVTEPNKSEPYQREPDEQHASTSAAPPPSPPARISRSSLDPTPPVPKKRPRVVGPAVRQNELLELACQYLAKDDPKPQSDTTPAIAKAWGEKLLTLETTQRIYAEKAINDVLFEASFGNLDRNSVSITVKNTSKPPSDSYCPSIKTTPLTDDELLTSAGGLIEDEWNRFPCGNNNEDPEATGTAEDYLENTEAPNDEDFFNPADMYDMYAAEESQDGNTIKQEAVNSQVEDMANVQAISSAENIPAVETDQVAIVEATSNETAHYDAATVHPEARLEVVQELITVPVNDDVGYEITEIIENGTSYQQPLILFVPNLRMSDQSSENLEMETSSILDQSLTSYFKNFTA